MSSFYKSNLMDGYDSLLIQPENDLKKGIEIIESGNVSVERNNSLKQYQEKPMKPIYYPYGNIIYWSLHLSFVLVFLFFLFGCYVTTSSDEREDYRGAIIPEKFLDPCNFTNVIPLNEIHSMKNTIEAINVEKKCINTVAKYNISADANEYLTTKLTNLTTTSNNLKKQLKEQKEIRFDCYKQNLQKRCEEQSRSKNLEKFLIIYCFYVCLSLILLSIPYCFILKARKMELSLEQKQFYDDKMDFLILIATINIVFPLLPIIATNRCSVESDLEKFNFL